MPQQSRHDDSFQQQRGMSAVSKVLSYRCERHSQSSSSAMFARFLRLLSTYKHLLHDPQSIVRKPPFQNYCLAHWSPTVCLHYVIATNSSKKHGQCQSALQEVPIELMSETLYSSVHSMLVCGGNSNYPACSASPPSEPWPTRPHTLCRTWDAVTNDWNEIAQRARIIVLKRCAGATWLCNYSVSAWVVQSYRGLRDSMVRMSRIARPSNSTERPCTYWRMLNKTAI